MVAEMTRLAGLKYLGRGEDQVEARAKAYRLGMWIAGGLLGFAPAIDYCKSNGIKAQGEDTPASGGVLVPTEFTSMILDLRERYGAFRANTRVVPMSSDVKQVARRTTGLTVYWVDEGSTVTDSSQQWDAVTLSAKKLGAMSTFTNELFEDAIINLADEFAFEVAWAFSQREDECGFIADGTSTYKGMMGIVNKLTGLSATVANIAGLQVATGTGYGTNYASMTLDDFSNTAALLPAYADTPNTGWFMHRQFFSGTAQRLNTKVGGAVDYEPESVGGRPRRPLFLGYPVNFTQVMPKAAAINQVCALFGDIARSSKLGDRRQIKIMINLYANVATDQIQIVAFQRFDAITHDVGNASATAALRVPGPVVGLITAGS